jgi:hypothetical protein
MSKLNAMGRACDVQGGEANASKVFVGKLKETDCLEGLGLDGRVILTWILKERDVRVWTGLIWVRIG